MDVLALSEAKIKGTDKIQFSSGRKSDVDRGRTSKEVTALSGPRNTARYNRMEGNVLMSDLV